MPAGLSLACGVGAAVAVFAIVSALWFRPLAVRDADRMVIVHVPIGAQTSEQEVLNAVRVGLAKRLVDLPVFDAVVFEATDWEMQPLLRPSLALRDYGSALTVAAVTPNYFSDLGIAVSGRDLGAAGSGDGANESVVLSDRLWHALGGSPELIGSRLSTTTGSVLVAGVAPRGFRGVRYGTNIDVWIPIDAVPRYAVTEPGAADFVPATVYARLKPGVTLEDAQTIVRNNAHQTAVLRHLRDVAHPVRSNASVDRQKQLLGMLLFAAGAVILVGCTNLASLWLAKAASERNEYGLRIILGCSPGRMAVTLMSQVCALGLISAVTGLAFGWILLRIAVTQTLPAGLSLADLQPTVDWRVALSAFGVAMGAALVAALAPLLDLHRIRLTSYLANQGQSSSPAGVRSHQVLVAAHTALTMTLIVVAVHLGTVVLSAEWTDRGYAGDTALYLTVRPRVTAPGQPVQSAYADYLTLLERLRAIRGVTAADFGVALIRTADPPTVKVVAGDQAAALAVLRVRGGLDYGRALGLRVVEGRLLTRQDLGITDPEPVIIDAALALQLWPVGPHVGQVFSIAGKRAQVIGVVNPIQSRQKIGRPTFLVLGAGFGEGQILNSISVPFTIGIDSSSPPPVAAIRAIASATFQDPSSLSLAVGTDLIRDGLAGERMGAVMFGMFGAAAGLLAVTGTYGLGMLGLARSRRATGIRLALGAPESSIIKSQLLTTLTPVIVGVGTGLLLSAWLRYFLSRAIPDYGDVGPITYLVSAAVYFVAVSAFVLPIARRARAIRPAEILRTI